MTGRLLCLAFSCIGTVAVRGQEESPVSAADITQRFNQAYSTFREEFRSATAVDVRLKLVADAKRDLNALLAPHLTGPLMKSVLPALEQTLIVPLDESLVTVVDEHPDPATRAQALLTLAKYYGNNQNKRLREAALQHLVRTYGNLKHKGTAYRDLAEATNYFFDNIAVGCDAPATVGEDEDGTLLRLSDYRGKVVMLRFWGNWCPVCRAMYPYERELVDRYRGEPFVLLGVNSDPKEVMQQAQAASNLVWRSIWDGGDSKGPIAGIYKVTTWPSVIVIDARGKIRARFEGFESHGSARKSLDAMLGQLVDEARRMNEAGGGPESRKH
jgi:thiol-disulfide isomerase/thioredoxin